MKFRSYVEPPEPIGRCSEVGVFSTVTAAADRPVSPRTAGTCSTSSTHRFRRHSAA